MPGIRYTTSLDGAAGVRVDEVTPPAVVVGVQQQTPLIVGECVKGPVDEPVLITGVQQFLNVFGGRDTVSGGTFTGLIWRALLNKTMTAFYAVRAAAAAAAAATVELLDGATPVLQVDASSVGAWGNGITVDVVAATDGDANKVDVIARWRKGQEATAGGREERFRNISITAGNDNTAAALAAVSSDGNLLLITLTKLADGVPDPIAAAALTTGSDGSIADTDFTATGRALEVAATVKDAVYRHVSGRSNTAVKAKIVTLAGTANSGDWLIGPDNSAVTAADWITEVNALARSDRFIATFNHPRTLDGATAEIIEAEPMDWMSNILSQTPINISPASVDSVRYTRGIASLVQGNLSDEDYDSLGNASITAMEFDPDYGFKFVEGCNALLEDGTARRRITRRQLTDFILANLAKRAKADTEKPNDQLLRDERAAAYESFLRGLQNERFGVEAQAGGTDGFRVDLESLNTPEQRALGIQKDLVRVKLIPDTRILQLVGEVGSTVTFAEEAA